MATTTVVRPPQALRNRRDASRPSISKRQNTMDGTAASEPASKKRKLTEPYVRDSQYILSKHQGKPPSLVVHLYDTTFRFEGQDISWTYDSPMKCIIQHLRRSTVPHEMMEELLSPAIQWYDGCLIVEVQNHRTKDGKEKGRQDSGTADGQVKFSMHNYTPHITPSPMVAFPSKAINDEATENGASSSSDMPAPERPKDKAGPTVTTLVLHPTPLSQHHEVMILMKTPAEQMRSKKRGSEAINSAGGQPSTPQVSVPPTPLTQTSRGPLAPSQKMCLEEGDLYTFQADLLVSTEPPLFLDPVDNPQDAERVLEMLQHPLHQAQPPSPKTRKRTTAEVAADDAQAAETERRMLIMDERIKPTGTGAGANENQSAAASLGFSRFKTIEMVRQKHEEADRQKKEDEARAAMEKKQLEEQNAAQQRAEQLAAKQRHMQLLAQQQQQAQAAQQQAAAQQQRQQQPTTEQQQQQQLAMQMRVEQMKQRQALNQQQQMMNAATHGHPQQNGMLPNGQPGFQQINQVSMAQSSPIVQQQTPMMNSSPMVAQGGFPMVASSSQGAGSPPRPTSMAIQNGMSRQASQQHPGSRNNTPQLPQGTPGMVQAVPNRPPTQTPRMQPSSPAAVMQQQGTPTSMSIPMQTPQMSNQGQFPPEQSAADKQQQRIMQTMQTLTANFNAKRQNAAGMLRQAQATGNVAAVQAVQADLERYRQHYERSRAAIMAQQAALNASMAANGSQAGSPGSMQQPTPQMAHAHPQQAQQPNGMQEANSMQMAQQKAHHLAAVRQNAQAQQQVRGQYQATINQLSRQYGGFANIPQQVLSGLPAGLQNMIMVMRQQAMQRNQAQAQAQAAMRASAAQQQQAQAQQHNGSELVPGSQPNPQFMQQLRTTQAMRQQQMAQGQPGGMNTLGMQSFTMNGMGGAAGGMPGNTGFTANPGVGADDLTRQFAAMQDALNQQQQQQNARRQQQQQQQGGGGGVQ